MGLILNCRIWLGWRDIALLLRSEVLEASFCALLCYAEPRIRFASQNIRESKSLQS